MWSVSLYNTLCNAIIYFSVRNVEIYFLFIPHDIYNQDMQLQ